MKKYIAFLRGINVGGKAMIKMADLQTALTKAGLDEVRTYIQSGNVIFSSKLDTTASAKLIKKIIEAEFTHIVEVVVFTAADWEKVIKAAPKWWGENPEWKHNMLILLPPVTAAQALKANGTLKPDIEAVEAGKGVLYQSVSFKMFGRTTASKLIGTPLYKQMTIRNYNTATKLLSLLK